MARGIFRFTLKAIKWLLLFVVLLLLLGSAVGWYLIATDSGYRRIPVLVNHLTPYHLSYTSLEGNLLHRQRWENLLIRGPGLRFQAARVALDCVGAALWHRRVHCPTLAVENARLHLPAAKAEEKSASGGMPESLPRLHLPLRIDIDRFSVDGLMLYRQEKPLATVKKSVVSAHLDGSKLRLSTEIALSRANGRGEKNTYAATLDGALTLSGDYPLMLDAQADIRLAEKSAQRATLKIDGSLLAPRATLHADGWLKGDLSLAAKVSLAQRRIDGALLWWEVALDGKRLESPEGEVHLNGDFDDLRATVQTAVSGARVPNVRIVAEAQLGNHRLDEVTLHTLGGEIALRGNADFQVEPRWQGEVTLRDLDLGRYDKALDAQLGGAFVVSGAMRDGDVSVRAAIRSLSGSWRGRPITGGGALTYRNERLDIDKLHLDVAGNTLTADGSLSEHSDFKAVLNAPALAHLLPGLTGAVTGNVAIGGRFKNPVFDAGLDWKDVRLLRNGVKTAVFASRAGTLTARGDLNALKVQLDAQATGEKIPETAITGGATVSRSAARALDLKLNTLNGLVRVGGELHYGGALHWRLNGELRGIEPQGLSPALQGTVNARLSSSGAIDLDGVLHALLDLPALSGSWAGQTLDGELHARVDGDALALKALDLAVGGNTIKARGTLKRSELALDFALDAPRLGDFHPALHGALHGEGRITGTAAAPQIRATLEGGALAFRDNRIEQFRLKLDTTAKQGGVFANELVASGISAAGRNWSRIALDTAGRFDAHTITVKGESGGYTLTLSARGGGRDVRHWQGGIDILNLRGSGLDWSLAKPVPVVLSPETMSFDDLCLSDRYSAFCLTLKKQRRTALSYRIDALDPRSFAAFMPTDLELTSHLEGTGDLILAANGDIEGNADLSLTPGRITITTENQAPIVLTLAAASWRSRFSEQQGAGDLSIRFADAGALAARVQVSDFRRPKVRGTLDIQIPDIGKFRYFVPRVSELHGRIDAKLAFSGPVAQPEVKGHLILDDGEVAIPEYASELKDIRIRLATRDSGAIDIDGNITTAKGGMNADGVLNLQPLTLRLHLRGKDMLLADSKKIRVLATPDFAIRIDPEHGIVVKGEVLIPEATIDIPDTTAARHPSDDVVILGGRKKPPRRSASAMEAPLQADIAVTLGDKVFFRNANVDIRLIGGIDVTVRPKEPPSGEGRIEVASGVYELYGQELDIERGWATFSGAIDRPLIDVLALREVESVKVGARVSGTPQTLHLELTSTPTLPDSAILSYLLFGRPPDATTDSTALLQTAAAIGTKGFFPDDLAGKTGLDVLDIGIGGLKAGKYLFRDLYVGMKSNFFSGITRFLTRYRLTRRLSLEASAQALENVVDLLYEFETD